MTADELMIGDWVKIQEPDKYAGAVGRICSLTSVEGGYFAINIQDPQFGYLVTEVFGDDIVPIPLTADILENNGFEKDVRNENYYKWNWYILEDNASYDMETGKVRLFKSSNLTFCHPIGYVHELQHALRLCEIDKEIAL